MPRKPWGPSSLFDVWLHADSTVTRAVDADTAATAAGVDVATMRAALSAYGFLDSVDTTKRITPHFSISG
jgi:hypothetical protein